MKQAKEIIDTIRSQHLNMDTPELCSGCSEDLMDLLENNVYASSLAIQYGRAAIHQLETSNVQIPKGSCSYINRDRVTPCN